MFRKKLQGRLRILLKGLVSRLSRDVKAMRKSLGQQQLANPPFLLQYLEGLFANSRFNQVISCPMHKNCRWKALPEALHRIAPLIVPILYTRRQVCAFLHMISKPRIARSAEVRPGRASVLLCLLGALPLHCPCCERDKRLIEEFAQEGGVKIGQAGQCGERQGPRGIGEKLAAVEVCGCTRRRGEGALLCGALAILEYAQEQRDHLKCLPDAEPEDRRRSTRLRLSCQDGQRGQRRSLIRPGASLQTRSRRCWHRLVARPKERHGGIGGSWELRK
ncbi:hypothetical protein MPH_08848 [Macrophomina phaseolina MS6]|uniref:Uncharacterized protein n=1 Tax=Macrophomina phaseolina (strain MS6) TaxID=1126212 RepID=K2RUX0_MACPH|nr:hypothetical protein MPH_08848 [Macrophomina phaseolina MS6]